MQINEYNSSEEITTYTGGTSTEGSSEPEKPEVTSEIKIKKEYGLAKPKRKVVRAKIFSE